MTTTMTADDVEQGDVSTQGVFAALLAELRAEADASYRALEALPGPAPCRGNPATSSADVAAAGERWTAREPLAERKRPQRRRGVRLQALKARRVLLHRARPETLGLEDLYPREESLATRCVRPSLRFLAHHDVVVVREPPGDAGGGGRLELREIEPAAVESVSAPLVEVERVRVLKPAGVVAHLQALDLALSLADGAH